MRISLPNWLLDELAAKRRARQAEDQEPSLAHELAAALAIALSASVLAIQGISLIATLSVTH